MLTLNDGRAELWQWDTGRTLAVDADCSQVHFSNKVFGRSIDVDVVDGVAIIPDIMLQTEKDLFAWAFVGTAENGYTKISKVFKVNRRNKPADYVFTPSEQTTLGEILERLEDLEAIQEPDAIKNAVDDYLANNPVKVRETDPTVPEWAKKPNPPDVKIPDKLPNPHSLTFTGAVNASYDGADPVEINIPGSGGNANQSGLSAEASALLITILRNGVYSADQSGNITALATVLGVTEEEEPDTPVEPDEPVVPEVTLTSISATYSGGDVAVGAAVSELTGIVVKAHYSDGTSKAVTGYTLSGTIAEGSNTITVSYGGKTTTFTVTGVAESGGGGDTIVGVSSINWFIATNDPTNGTIATAGLKEPDNGYVVTTDTAHTAADANRHILAFPLISGKTYSIRISNADEANQQFFGLWVSTLNIKPVKGEVTAVTDTIVKNIIAWYAAPANGYRDYTYTAGNGEYLMINANAGNILTITAEVTA